MTKHIFDEDIPNIFDEGMTVGGGMTDASKQLERNYLDELRIKQLKVQPKRLLKQLVNTLVIRLGIE